MGKPAGVGHLQNMKEFGVKRENEERRDGGCAVIFDPQSGLYAVYKNAKSGRLGLYGGGFDDGEDEETGVLREVEEESGLFDFSYIEKIEKVLSHYHNINKDVNRVTFVTCFLFVLRSKDRKETKLEEHEKFSLTWATPEEILSSWEQGNQNKDYDHSIYLFNKAKDRLQELGYVNKG